MTTRYDVCIFFCGSSSKFSLQVFSDEEHSLHIFLIAEKSNPRDLSMQMFLEFLESDISHYREVTLKIRFLIFKNIMYAHCLMKFCEAKSTKHIFHRFHEF